MATHSVSHLATIENGKSRYDRAAIMRHAHHLRAREAAIIERIRARGEDAGELEPFAHFLKQAWADAKGFAGDLIVAERQRQEASPLKRRIFDLTRRTRLGARGLAELAGAYRLAAA